MTKVEYFATDHAYKRAKQRFHWKKNTLDRMIKKAFMEGIKHSDTKGSLKKYINSLWFKYKFVNNVRIYGENIYFFKDTLLITLYRVENKLIKHLKHYK